MVGEQSNIQGDSTLKQISKNRVPISSFVVCKNEEQHIAQCLESLSFCDEIIVVDSFSTDKTVEICRNFNVKFIQKEWPGYREQKEFACRQTSNDWVLFIDADEVVSKELRDDIITITSNMNARKLNDHRAFEVNRVMYFMGRWWRRGGWLNEKRVRFFHKEFIRWVGKEPHENIEVNGTVGQLAGELFHFSYEDLPDQIKKISSHAFVRAKADYVLGRKVFLYEIVTKPFLRFLKFYIWKRGLLEGIPGFISAIVEGFYTFLKYARLWELQNLKDQNKDVNEAK